MLRHCQVRSIRPTALGVVLNDKVTATDHVSSLLTSFFEFAVCNASPSRPRTASRLTPGCVSSNRYCKTYLRCSSVVGPLLGERLCTTGRFLAAHQAIWLLFWRHYNNQWLVYCCWWISVQACAPRCLSTRSYCNRYYLLKPVSVTIYVLVTTTDNYLESLLTLTTLASSLECSTLTHINSLLLSFTLTFIVCIVNVAICQLF